MQETAIFAAGCFWCVEAQFQRVKGVSEVKSGYSGGRRDMATYEEVKKGNTGHHQVIRIIYDPQIVSFEKLLQIFFAVHDPCKQDGEGQDIGSQYKSAVFYFNQTQKKSALKKIEELHQSGVNALTVVRPFEYFFEAEEYHQNYWNLKGSQNAYCTIIPGKLAKLKNLFKEYYVQAQ